MEQKKRPSNDDDDDQEHESIQEDDTVPIPVPDPDDDKDAPGGESDRGDIEQILASCEARIRALIRRRFPGLDEHRVNDVLQQVAVALLEELPRRDGKSKRDDDIEKYAVRVAWNKACDILRNGTREASKLGAKRDLLASQFSLWDMFTPAEQAEVSAIVAETARTLTPFQLWLWERYVEHYPKSGRGNFLAKVTGVPLSSPDMKRWIAEIRSRFFDNLRDKGYDLD
jgi:DNA-directed RNA polymerase specialized sigma24 family protein